MAKALNCPQCGFVFDEAVEPALAGLCPRCLAAGATKPTTHAGSRHAATRIEVIGLPFKPGGTFRGYAIGERIGQGGMGVVFRATQTSLGRPVALKVLAPQFATADAFVRRFEREAKVLASLNHPNVVQVYDFGREGDVLYLAMEYVDGKSLEERFREGLVEPAAVLAMLRQVSLGLGRVHEAGLVHRDLKPSNVFITKEGVAKLGDFGLAVESDGAQKLTESGCLVGTPHYVSPEHAQGKKVDGRSDLYALGVVLYEGLAGRPPFQAPSATALLLKHVNEPPPPLHKLAPHAPRSVQELVRRLLAKNPAARPESAAHVARDLERALAELGRGPSPRVDRVLKPPSASAPGKKPFPVKLSAGVAGAALLLAALVAMLSGGPTPPPPPPKPAAPKLAKAAPPTALSEAEPEKQPEPSSAPQTVDLPKPAEPAPAEPPPDPFAPAMAEADRLFEEAREAFERGKAATAPSVLAEAAFKAEEARAKYRAVAELGQGAQQKRAEEQVKTVQQFVKLANEARLAMSAPTVPAPSPSPPAPPAPASPAEALLPVPEAPPVRAPVPDPSAQQAAERSIRDIFRDEYARKGMSDVRALALRLLDEGRRTTDDAAARFVLLREARDLAAQAGDLETSFAAVDAAAEVFAEDPLPSKMGALQKAASSARTPEAARGLANGYLHVSEAAAAADDYDVAAQAAARAEAAARSGQDPALAARAVEVRKETVYLRDEYARVRTFFEKPGTGDPDAAGRFLCLVKGDWTRGLEVLAQAPKSPLRVLAEKDLASPDDAAAQTALGDEWWELAEKERSPLRKSRLQARAAYWYGQASPQATGLVKAKLEKRLLSIPATGSGVVDLLKLLDPSRHAIHGTWTRAGDALLSAAPDFFSRIVVPYEPPDEYDLQVTVERLDGEQDFYVGLVQGKHLIGATLDAGNGTYSEIQQGLARHDGPVFKRGKPSQVTYKVRKGSVEVHVDGRRLLNYRGDLSRGGLFNLWSVGRTALFLGSHGSAYRIHRAVLVTVSGQGRVASASAVPPPPVAAPAPLRIPPAAPKGAIDLLALVDPSTDAVKGEWVLEKGILTSPVGSHIRLRLPYQPPDEYDLHVSVERVEGADGLLVGLVRGSAQWAVTIDSQPAQGYRTGFESLDGEGPSSNATTVQGPVLRAEGETALEIRVRRTGTAVLADGRTIIDWKGQYGRLSLPDGWKVDEARALFLGCWGTRYRFSRILLVPLGGAGRALRPANVPKAGAPARPVDLLAAIDPARDVVRGEWKRTTRGLASPSGPDNLLQVPYAPPEEYDLEVVVEWKDGPDGMGMGLVGGGRQVMLMIGSWHQSRNGLRFVDDKMEDQNEASFPGTHLRKNKPVLIRCAVRKSSLDVWVDQRKVWSWKADWSRVSSGGFATPSSDALAICSLYGVYEISRLILVPVSGTGRTLR